jgi:hypothetical protein
VEYHRRQAKALVRAFRAGEPEARARAEAVLGARAAERFLLSGAQHVVAREAGYRTWRELRAAQGEERLVDSGLEYVPGESVLVHVRRRLAVHIDDRGRAVELAGRPSGWLEVAERTVEEYALNVNRRGVVFVETVYEAWIDELTARTAEASLAVYQELLELAE